MELRRRGENTREEDREKLVGELWRLGKIGVALESYLLSDRPAGTFFEKNPELTQTLTRSQKQECLEVINRYRDLVKTVREAFQKWSRIHASKNPFRTKEEMANVFLKTVGGYSPVGSVTLTESRGFFTLTCEMDELCSIGKSLMPHMRNLEAFQCAHGAFLPNVSLSSRGPSSETLCIPVILMSSGRADQSQTLQEDPVFIHERQHLINSHILSLFRGEKPRPSPESSLHVKDELLAFLREGVSPKSLPKQLSPELYPDLFQGEDAIQQVEMIQRISLALQEATYFQAHRAEFVYALIHTPLQKFPQRIKALNEYIGKHSPFLAAL